MEIGQKVTSCSGQDLTRRGAKSKNQRMMMVLPSQLAFKGADIVGTLGRIEKANTENPELVIETSKGDIRCIGKFVLTSSLYFSVKLQPRLQSSVCEDVFDRVLVFDEPRNNHIDVSDCTKEITTEFFQAFGCSRISDPLSGRADGEDDEVELDEDEEEEIIPTKVLPSRAQKEVKKKYVEKGSESETSNLDLDDSSSEEAFESRKNSKTKSNPKVKATPKTKKESSSYSSGSSKKRPVAPSSSTKRKKKMKKSDSSDDDSDDDNDDNDDVEIIEYIPKPSSRRASASTVKSHNEADGDDDDDDDDDESEDDDDDDDDDSDF